MELILSIDPDKNHSYDYQEHDFHAFVKLELLDVPHIFIFPRTFFAEDYVEPRWRESLGKKLPRSMPAFHGGTDADRNVTFSKHVDRLLSAWTHAYLIGLHQNSNDSGSR